MPSGEASPFSSPTCLSTSAVGTLNSSSASMPYSAARSWSISSTSSPAALACAASMASAMAERASG